MSWGCRSALLAVAFSLVFPGGALGFGALDGFGEFGVGLGQLREPAQIAIAENGDLYVADSGNDRISVFTGDGTFVRTFGEGALQEPEDVELAGGVVFVADAGGDRIDVFTDEGAHLFSYGAGELSDPTGLAVDGSTVFVADSGNDRVAVFDAGTFVEAIGLGLLSSPRDAILGPDGLLYVADYGNERVAVFDAGGELVRSIGDGAGKLSGPVALAVADGELLVADEVAERVERFDPDGAHLRDFVAGPGVAGVGAACDGNVFAVERDTAFARVERFGDPDTPAPPCLRPQPVAAPIVQLQPPSNRFRFNGLRLIRGNGMAILFVRVPDPGKLWLWGRGIRPLKRVVRRARRVNLPVRPKVPLKRYLKRRGKGRIRVNVGFEPFGGDFRKREKAIVLRRHRRR